MSTRGSFTFHDKYESFNVYNHCDNYPTGAAEVLRRALQFAWDLPRFEANEFACAFIAAQRTLLDEYAAKLELENPDVYGPNSKCGSIKKRYRQGGSRLLKDGGWREVSPMDIEYHYDVTCKNGKLFITAHKVSSEIVTMIFSGSLENFEKFKKD